MYTSESEGKYVSSIVTVNDKEVNTQVAPVALEDTQGDATEVKLMNEVRLVSTENKKKEMRKQDRLEHLNGRERKGILKMCERYNDVFYLPGERLTSTHSVVHSIATPGIDLYQTIASRNYGILEALKHHIKKNNRTDVKGWNIERFDESIE